MQLTTFFVTLIGAVCATSIPSSTTEHCSPPTVAPAPPFPPNVAEYWKSHNPLKASCFTPAPSSLAVDLPQTYASHAAWYNTLISSIRSLNEKCPGYLESLHTGNSTWKPPMPKDGEEPMFTPRDSEALEKKGVKELPKSWTEFEGMWTVCGNGSWNGGETGPKMYEGGAKRGESFVASVVALAAVIAFAAGL